MAVPTRIEDELGKRWDRCLADVVLKFGAGILVGGLSSLILFKRRSWPVVMGSGFGIGLAYGNCEKELNKVITVSSSSQGA